MAVVAGIWFALVGGIAALAGLSGMRASRRLRRDGVSAWAVAVPPAAPAGDAAQPGKAAQAGQAGGEPDWPPHRTMIQYALADGQVIERISPQPARKAAALRPGQQVLVWYDPADPQDVLVYGREGRIANRLFVAAGVLFILIGGGLALFLS
jgi:hypothetical protein